MNKVARYIGYGVTRFLDFILRNWFKLIVLAILFNVMQDFDTLVRYAGLIGQRFYDFTDWYHHLFAGKTSL